MLLTGLMFLVIGKHFLHWTRRSGMIIGGHVNLHITKWNSGGEGTENLNSNSCEAEGFFAN